MSLRHPAPHTPLVCLQSIPLLVLGNKNDLPGALGVQQLTDALNLKVGRDGEQLAGRQG